MSFEPIQQGELEITSETARAYQVQNWFGSSSNPEAAARLYWIPKSACRVCMNPARDRRFLESASSWWIARNGLRAVVGANNETPVSHELAANLLQEARV